MCVDGVELQDRGLDVRIVQNERAESQYYSRADCAESLNRRSLLGCKCLMTNDAR